MNTAVATNQTQGGALAHPEPPLHKQIEAMNDKFKAALPAHVPVERFSRFALLTLQNPNVAEATKTPTGRTSLFKALLQAAADGLMPDGRESALVPYDKKVNGEWVKTVQYQSMVAGIMKKARNSGEIASIVCQIRYRNDLFRMSFVSDGAPIVHELADGDRGEMVGVYALCRFKDGTWSQPEYLTKVQVDQIRARTKSRKKVDGEMVITGPWVTDYEEMARKTAIRRASKSWPSSTDLEALHNTIRAGDEMTDVNVIDHAPIPSDRKKPQAAALLGQDAKGPDDEDEGGGDERDDDEDLDDDQV